MIEEENGTEFFQWEIIVIKCTLKLIDILTDFLDKGLWNQFSKDHLYLETKKKIKSKLHREKITLERRTYLQTSTLLIKVHNIEV